jgi:hypothetical protein
LDLAAANRDTKEALAAFAPFLERAELQEALRRVSQLPTSVPAP